MPPIPLVLALPLLLVLAASPTRADSGAVFFPLGDLPGGPWYSQGFGVTNRPDLLAAGGSKTAAGQEIFRWGEAFGLESLGELPGGSVSGEARGMSADGSVVVGFSEGAQGLEAFRWSEAGGLEGLGDLPGGDFLSRAWAVTPDGQTIAGEATGPGGTVAVLWTEAGGFQSLGELPGGAVGAQAFAVTPDASVAVGASSSDLGLEAFRWTAARGMHGLGVLPGGTSGSRAKAVSPDGSVVVGFSSRAGGFEAFRWTAEEGLVGLGDLPGGNVFAQANGVSADGSIVVGLSATGNPEVPFTFEAMLWTARHGMRRLQDVLEEDYGLSLPGWTLWEVLAITPDGHAMVGIAYNPQGEREAFVVTLPDTACHDGVDQDGDGLVDLDDPACRNLADNAEQSACQNGLDDDADGTIDFDGGVSIHGAAIALPDTRCQDRPWRRSEARHCGLGAELGLLAGPLLLLVRRFRRSGRRGH